MRLLRSRDALLLGLLAGGGVLFVSLMGSIRFGAALAVVGAVFLFGASSLTTYALFAFLGAGVAAVVVYGLGSLGREGMTPIRSPWREPPWPRCFRP